MDAAPASPGADEPRWQPLIDVSELPIAAMHPGDDSVLGRSIRQLISSLDDPNGVISAFQSFVSDT